MAPPTAASASSSSVHPALSPDFARPAAAAAALPRSLRRRGGRRRGLLAVAAAAAVAAIGSSSALGTSFALGLRGSATATSPRQSGSRLLPLRVTSTREAAVLEDDPELAYPRSASKGRLPELEVERLRADKRQLRQRVDAFEQERERLLAQVQQWKRDGSLDEDVLKALQESFSRIVPDKVTPRRLQMPELDAERVAERQHLDHRVDSFQEERRRLLAQIHEWKQQGSLDGEVLQVLTELLGKPSRTDPPSFPQEAAGTPFQTASEEALSARLAAAADQLKRQADEFQRFRERVANEEEARATAAKNRLAAPLLDLLESFERALLHGAGEDAQERIRPLQGQLLEVLKRELDIEPMEYSVGEQFDPSFHEAVGVAAGPQSADTILEELARGYRVASDGSVVRPAKVLVCTGPAER